AHPGDARDAPADLHLPGRPRVGVVEPGHDGRGAAADAGGPLLRGERGPLAPERGAGRRRPVGRLDPRVGHHLPAARVQLRGGPRGRQPPAPVGPEASRRSGRATRMTGHAGTHPGTVGHEWRGRAGMIGLIVAEASLFGVFVVAYLYYTGKS